MPKGIYNRTKAKKGGMFGKKHSEKTKQQITNKLQGRHLSIATEFKKGCEGFPHKHTEASKRKMSLTQKGKMPINIKDLWKKRTKKSYKVAGEKNRNNLKLKIAGKIAAEKRWNGHVAKNPGQKNKPSYLRTTRVTKTPGELLARKRFRNQRYRANKRNAEGSHTFVEWEQIKKTYHYMCLCCKGIEPEIKLTEDHIIPLSMGGTDYIWNIQPLCVQCNTRKHAKVMDYRSSGNPVQILN